MKPTSLRGTHPLIFDEVVTSFRLGLGGASEYYGVIPDLVCLGKILGEGFPSAATAGAGISWTGPLFLSTAHTQQDVDRILEVAEAELRAMRYVSVP